MRAEGHVGKILKGFQFHKHFIVVFSDSLQMRLAKIELVIKCDSEMCFLSNSRRGRSESEQFRILL